MEVFLIRLLQFLLAISLLVLLHEGGHLFFSKLFGVRVEKFFMFFDIGIGKWNGSLFQFKPKNSDTKVRNRLASARRILQDCRHDR